MIAGTDPALWTTRRVFGVAGGPDEIVLTDEGNARAFSVGASVRRLGPAEALEALHTAEDAPEQGYLALRGEGSGIRLTALARFDRIAWGHLRDLGLVSFFQDGNGDGVRLTDAGKRAVRAGIEERCYLLERCRRCIPV